MRRYKKHILILVISIVIFFILSFVYNKIIKNNNDSTAYILTQNVSKGQAIDISQMKIINISNKVITDELLNINDINNQVYADSYSVGQVLLKNCSRNKEEYKEAINDKEIISIKINNAQDIVSYQLKKGDIVNIYYTGKYKQAQTLLNNDSNPNIYSGNEDGYITIKLLSESKILGIYDKYGQDVSSKNMQDNVIDTVMVEVEKELVMKIDNLKNYGNFSLSLLR